MVGIEIMMQVGKNHYFYKWSQAWYLIALPQKDLKGVLYSVSRERNNVFSATSNKHWWLGVFYLSTEITIQLEKNGDVFLFSELTLVQTRFPNTSI